MKSAKLRVRSEKTLTVIWICVTIDGQNAGADQKHQHQPCWIQHHFFSESIFYRKSSSNPERKKDVQSSPFRQFSIFHNKYFMGWCLYMLPCHHCRVKLASTNRLITLFCILYFVIIYYYLLLFFTELLLSSYNSLFYILEK